MYEVADVVARIDGHLVVVIVFTLIAWVTGFVQIIEALRLGRRDVIPAVPIAMTAYLLAHDATYAAHYDLWFNEIGHWYFKVFWLGMLGAVLVEVVLVGQFLAYGPREIAPRLPRRVFAAVYLVFQALAFLLIWWIQSLFDDPLLLITLASTQIAAVVPLVPWILTRGSARGQSRIFAWATLLGPGSLALGLFPALSGMFNTWQYYAVVACLVVLSVIYLALLEHYRGRSQPTAPATTETQPARPD